MGGCAMLRLPAAAWPALDPPWHLPGSCPQPGQAQAKDHQTGLSLLPRTEEWGIRVAS